MDGFVNLPQDAKLIGRAAKSHGALISVLPRLDDPILDRVPFEPLPFLESARDAEPAGEIIPKVGARGGSGRAIGSGIEKGRGNEINEGRAKVILQGLLNEKPRSLGEREFEERLCGENRGGDPVLGKGLLDPPHVGLERPGHDAHLAKFDPVLGVEPKYLFGCGQELVACTKASKNLAAEIRWKEVGPLAGLVAKEGGKRIANRLLFRLRSEFANPGFVMSQARDMPFVKAPGKLPGRMFRRCPEEGEEQGRGAFAGEEVEEIGLNLGKIIEAVKEDVLKMAEKFGFRGLSHDCYAQIGIIPKLPLLAVRAEGMEKGKEARDPVRFFTSEVPFAHGLQGSQRIDHSVLQVPKRLPESHASPGLFL